MNQVTGMNGMMSEHIWKHKMNCGFSWEQPFIFPSPSTNQAEAHTFFSHPTYTSLVQQCSIPTPQPLKKKKKSLKNENSNVNTVLFFLLGKTSMLLKHCQTTHLAILWKSTKVKINQISSIKPWIKSTGTWWWLSLYIHSVHQYLLC